MTSEKYQRYKQIAFEKINPIIECSRCGCDSLTCLEVNHQNGNGIADRKIYGNGYNFFLSIINGQRDTNDLEILCRPCNAIDHLERKVGHILPMRVIWKKRGLTS